MHLNADGSATGTLMTLILILFKSTLDFWVIFSLSDIPLYRVCLPGLATDFTRSAFITNIRFFPSHCHIFEPWDSVSCYKIFKEYDLNSTYTHMKLKLFFKKDQSFWSKCYLKSGCQGRGRILYFKRTKHSFLSDFTAREKKEIKKILHACFFSNANVPFYAHYLLQQLLRMGFGGAEG